MTPDFKGAHVVILKGCVFSNAPAVYSQSHSKSGSGKLLLDESWCYYFTIRTTLVVARSFASASKHEYKKNMIADNTGSYLRWKNQPMQDFPLFQKQIQTLNNELLAFPSGALQNRVISIQFRCQDTGSKCIHFAQEFLFLRTQSIPTTI